MSDQAANSRSASSRPGVLASILRKLNLFPCDVAAAWGARPGLAYAWPDRAISRRHGKLARTGEAAAPRCRVSLMESVAAVKTARGI